MTLMEQVMYREHLHRERQGKHDTAFALAYAVLHQPTYAPDTRPETKAAPCAEVLDLHFDNPRVPIAIEMCNSCTIKKECLQIALDTNVTKGVWGGVHFG